MSQDDPGTNQSHTAAFAAWRLLRDAGDRLFGELTNGLPIGPHHLRALRAIEAGASSAATLADATDGHIASVSDRVAQLVTAGLVSRAPDPDDRRMQVLRLTRHGQTVVNRSHTLDLVVLHQITATLHPHEADQLAALLPALVPVLSQLADQVAHDPTMLDAPA